MNQEEFANFSSFLQDTASIINNPALRLKAYSEFSQVYDYLEAHQWTIEDLKERHSYHETAAFQNIAEGYYRLGFIEAVFYQYAKLIYELWFNKVIEFQNAHNQRIHKGTQVHQIAEIYSTQHKRIKAWDYYLAAFAEDVIDGRDYIESQAYRALRSQSLSKNNLVLYAESIGKLRGKAKYNPLQIVEVSKKNYLIPSYEDNESVDRLKLNKAQEVWEKLTDKEKEESQNE